MAFYENLPTCRSVLIRQLKEAQHNLMNVIMSIANQVIPDKRAPRDFRAKYPDDVLLDQISGECVVCVCVCVLCLYGYNLPWRKLVQTEIMGSKEAVLWQFSLAPSSCGQCVLLISTGGLACCNLFIICQCAVSWSCIKSLRAWLQRLILWALGLVIIVMKFASSACIHTV